MMARPIEAELLSNLKARRAHLEAALSKATDHWGFEDPVYRFYHQMDLIYRAWRDLWNTVAAGFTCLSLPASLYSFCARL